MTFNKQFSDSELRQISDEALLYMCACPAQVAAQLLQLRKLYAYQANCRADPENDPAVHGAIAAATADAHAVFEACLEKVLTLEGWDRATLTMPEGLRQKRDLLLGD
ncbi:hypothetical protein [Chitinimonas sp.]|uniref:hypothetical protein n=1 Tax=Chitinimonas sp. TaxID=1934313 RepID=UPI0035B384DE